MEKSTFASCSNYFGRLRGKTRNIDEGIEKLSETWKTPQLLIGGYAERTAETNVYLEGLWESIRNISVAIEKLQSKLEPSLDKTDQLLKESQVMYKDLKEQCDNLDIVLAEYGYHYDESNGGQENHSRNDNQNSMNNNAFDTEEMLDMEVEFTPNLTWKCKAKSRESDSSNTSQRNTIKEKNQICQHKDVFQRMNYLYQASHLMALKNRVMASYFGNHMFACAKKAVLRTEPNLKRTVCKCCQSPLIPGETARVRLVSKPIKGVKWTCLTCMNSKRYPTKKGYKLWLDQPESLVRILDFTPKSKNKNFQQLSSKSNLEEVKEQTEKNYPRNPTS
ncbi:Ribonuclease P protein subunit p21 [Trachymyrmex zeteki]|uniref:Ribonuclease P protein subunit p21 n=1 Tax=Mycetomoellerius zeteki TaxID=64791 RepID=A0A151XH26_9HYME|nr:Ribonuclease P protein subunit p21 [Trachymyrmex zeteki]